MTQEYHIKVDCYNCGCNTTAETGFSRWMRNQESLDSTRIGFVSSDLDYLVHRYKFRNEGKDDRAIECLMIVEVKTRGADPKPSQRDSLLMLGQLVSSRRDTPTSSNGRLTKSGRGPQVVYSAAKKRHVLAGFYGVHLLRFEHTSPDDSRWIKWDRHEITKDQLTSLLLFDLDPDNPAQSFRERTRVHHHRPRPSLPFQPRALKEGGSDV